MVTAQQYKQAPPVVLKPRARYTATIVTDYGELVLELFPKEAPRTVNSFVFLAREGFYQNNSFHRILQGALVQGGCPEGDGTGYPGYHIDDEEAKRPYVRGILAMASLGRNRNGSQFFIVHGDRVRFPPNYTIFGRLVEGDDVLDQLAAAEVEEDPRGELSRPTRRIYLYDIEVREDGRPMRAPPPPPPTPAPSPVKPGMKARLRRVLGIQHRPRTP